MANRSWAAASSSRRASSKGPSQPTSGEPELRAYLEGVSVEAVRNIDVGRRVVVWKGTRGTVLAPTEDSLQKGRVRIQFESRADGGKTSQAIMVHPTEIAEIELTGNSELTGNPLLVYLPAPEVQTSEKLRELYLDEIEPDMLTLGSQIGKGRFKTVHTGNHMVHGPVAVLRYAADSDRHEARVLGLLAKMEHGDFHFPEMFGAKEDPSGDLLLVQEVSMLGSVRSVLKEPDLAPMLTPTHRLHIAAQTAGAVDFLETARIIHTDIACRNVMIFQLEDEPELTIAKLTDFGCALTLPLNTEHVINRQPQATRWCAPETITSMKWSHKTDIWSLGATLWELFAGGIAPWTRLSKRSEVAKRLRDLTQNGGDVDEEFPAPEQGLYPFVAHTAVLACLQVDADLRPPACAVALAYEKLLELDEMFDGNSELIDEGLETVTMPEPVQQAPLPPRQPQPPRALQPTHVSEPHRAPQTPQSLEAPPVHERSRARNVSSSPGRERGPQDPAASPTLTPGRRAADALAEVVGTSSRSSTPVPRQVSARRVSSDNGSLLNQSVEASALGNGSSAIGTPNPLDATSTPSTTDTPSLSTSKVRPHERRPAEQQQPQQPVRAQSHFENLSRFLSSQEAAKAMNSEQLNLMKLEIASAQVREAYWSGLSDRRELRESNKVVVPLEPRGGNSWGVREQARDAPSQCGKWTLWTYVSPGLEKEDFSSELEARAVLSARSKTDCAAPCVLRDPCGKVQGGACWRTSHA